jgi:predicted enzyme related to lactoylglutathione lyase
MVTDMDAALAFYTQKLGLNLKARFENHYAEIEAGDYLLGLHPSDQRTVYGNNLSIGFGVTNFEETTNVLESNGVTLNVQRDGWSNIAHFADPDGNPLYVIEVK